MKESKVFKTTIGGREVSVEIGAYCGQSNGSCMFRCGDTVVMSNVTMAEEPKPGQDFFPLSVDFEEKMYAVGKIPGGFKKREGKPTDKGILTCRLTDRPIRPLFPKGMFHDVVITNTVLSVEQDIPPEAPSMVATSIALCISDIPFNEPTGSVIVGYVDGQFIINPNSEQRARTKLDLALSGTKDAIMMVEAGAQEITEEELVDAIMFGHEEIKKICAFIEEIKAAAGKPTKEIELYKIPEEIETSVKEYAYDMMVNAMDTTVRAERQAREQALEEDVAAHFAEIYPDKAREIGDVLYSMKKKIVREKVLTEGIRPDGRKITEIRPIWCEVGTLPRTHGSAVFTRGETQVLNVTTLGTLSEVQKLDGLDEEQFKRYMHQYNFPPYCTGEAKTLRTAGRREIGHGALAERALEPVLPSESDFPYAIRTVSEVLSSNGSSSMASVCGSTLSLMDAGVPIKAPVAGIAMGLIKTDDNYVILSDIQGLEDFLGDMDFKVAGTEKGITAIQMDIKIKGISKDIMKDALMRAREGRAHIMNKMMEVLDKPRTVLSKFAPKIISFSIDPDKIREVIGSGGKVINKIIEDTGVKIDISDEGIVFISSVDTERADEAKQIIFNIVHDPEVGDEYEGKVVKIMDFGAFVNLAPGKDGMVHISKLSDKRVEKVTDVVKLNDTLKVKVIKVDEKGRIDLKLVEKK